MTAPPAGGWKTVLVVLSPASHFANRDQPAAWNRTVLAFLVRVERSTG